MDSRPFPVELSDDSPGEVVIESSVVLLLEEEENHPDTVLPMEEKNPGPVVSSGEATVVASSPPSLVVGSVDSEAPSGACVVVSELPEFDDDENQLIIVDPTEEKVDGPAVVASSGFAVVVW